MSTGITIPRLSETLNPFLSQYVCQRCGDGGTGGAFGPQPFSVWREHDDVDRPEMIFIVLCGPCADRVIEPHPRLYRQLARNEPAPGIMAICGGCRHRTAGRCTSPKARANGGPGLLFPAETGSVHIQNADRRGRRCGRWERTWDREPVQCEGYEPRDGS